VLIGGIVAVVVAVGAVVGVLARRRAQDDAHSVEHYHRKLHTLEEIRAHPAVAGVGVAGAANGHGTASSDEHANGANGSWTPSAGEAAGGAGAEREAQGAGASRAGVAYPAGFVRLSGSSTVRLTEADQSPPPPAPPPPIASLSKPASFDDAAPAPKPSTFMSGNERAMDSISHRPRRLGGPLAAIAAVAVLIVILIVTGLHSTPSSTTSHSRSHSHSPSGSQAGSHAGPPRHRPATSTTVAPHHPSVTPTTVAPVVSAPTSTSASGATYTVGSANYALVLSATSGPCWLEATNPSTGAVLFSGTLFSGQSHTVTASGPVTVVVGAPSAFAATVDGTPVTLPAGDQAPFTLTFQTPQGPGAGSGSGSG
jgi:hypothetical protein